MSCIWDKLPDPIGDDENAGEALFKEYLQTGYLRRTLVEMLKLSIGAITCFYRLLAADRSIESPVKRFSSSGWMVDADFCFINIRATGMEDKPGNFIQAAKLLPAIRANAIHLGPFTDNEFDNVYAVRGLRTISPLVVDPQLAISPEDQLRAFVQAAHLLGKAVGFDLEPHVAQFAIPVILSPHLFRWFKLSADKKYLAGGMSEQEMLAEANQRQITAEIRDLVEAALRKEKIDNLESAEDDPPPTRLRKREVYFSLIGLLIARGYWPIPSQSWAGYGVPGFNGYDFDGNYARFSYRGMQGEDLSASAFHILTPYKFYTGLSANRIPSAPVRFEPGVDAYCKIFPYWRDGFGFDFVRYDSADHIFDSLTKLKGPVSDRATPDILQDCVRGSKAPDRAFIGNFAERMGNEIEAYAALGFDLILGDDMLQKADAVLVSKSLQLCDRLTALNQARPQLASICFCIDTHDTGDPALWGEPLVKVAGAAQMGLRHFLSRFSSAGYGRRPKYEVMGSQDLSYGLYEANIGNANLVWVGDKRFNQHYHYLEDIYEQYKSLLGGAEITHRHVERAYAWWLITTESCWLIPVIAFEKVEALTLDLTGAPWVKMVVALYDFDRLNETVFSLSVPRIEIQAMAPETAWLYVLKPGP